MAENFKIKSADDNGSVMFCGENSSLKNYLHLEGDGESESGECRALIYQGEKNSTSGDVWHGRTIEFNLPEGTKPEAVIEFLEDNRAEFQEFFNSYKSRWNGSNWIGNWGDTNEKTYRMQEKISSRENLCVSVFGDPSDYIDYAWSDFESDSEKPADMDFKKMAKELLEGNDQDEIYVNFSADDLAEYLEDNHEEIWTEE